MSLITIKTFDLSAEFEKVHKDTKSISIPKCDVDYVKSYWYYILFGNPLDGKPTKLRNNHTANIVYLDDVPSGLIISSRQGDAVNIDLLVVSDKCRGRGFGTMLLTECLNGNPTKKIYLEVHADNIGAIKLYRKHGFRLADLYGDYVSMMKMPRIPKAPRPCLIV